MAHCSKTSNLNRRARGPSWLMTLRSSGRSQKSCSQQATPTTFERQHRHSDSMTKAASRSEKCWLLLLEQTGPMAHQSPSAPPTCPSYCYQGPVAQPEVTGPRTCYLATSVAPSQKPSDQAPHSTTEAPRQLLVHFYRSQAWKRAPHWRSEASLRILESSS